MRLTSTRRPHFFEPAVEARDPAAHQVDAATVTQIHLIHGRKRHQYHVQGKAIVPKQVVHRVTLHAASPQLFEVGPEQALDNLILKEVIEGKL